MKVSTTVEGGISKDKGSTYKAVVYSFFHRELAPMAKDLINLLSESEAWVDPNLIALVPCNDKDSKGGLSKRKRRKIDKASMHSTTVIGKDIKPQNSNTNELMSCSEDEFASLVTNRIVLKRAGNVSDTDSE